MQPQHFTEGDATSPLEREIALLRRRCFQAAFVGRALKAAGLALLAAGCFALLWRIGLERDDGFAWAGFGALAVVVPYAALAARRAVPTRAQAAVWLDARSGGGGALVTAVELGHTAATGHAAQEQVRRTPTLPRLAPRTWLGAWPGALAFAVACVVVPVARPAGGAGESVEALLERGVERARERLTTLTEEVQIDEARATELAQRLERVAEEARDADLESGFEALDALEKELDRLASAGLDEALDAHEALARSAASSSSSQSATRAALEEAAQRMESGAFAPSSDRGLLEQLMELARSAESRLSDEPLGEVEDLDAWLEWLEEWSSTSQAARQELAETLERLVQAGLVDEAEAQELESSLASLEGASLDELAERLAEALAEVELSDEEAAALREDSAGLPPAPQLSPELQAALDELRAEAQERLGDVELPRGADLAQLLEGIDEELRAELFEALAQAQARQTAALEQALELDPQAFALDAEQIAALERALAEMKDGLASFIARELAPQPEPSRTALASELAQLAEDAALDPALREALGSALEDMFDVSPESLARALAALPPALRAEALERLAEHFDELAQSADAERLGDMNAQESEALARALESIARGPEAPPVEPLTEAEIARAIDALRAMQPGKPGMGIP
jgi:hypothetical protein